MFKKTRKANAHADSFYGHKCHMRLIKKLLYINDLLK